jgi:hypothetical protein
VNAGGAVAAFAAWSSSGAGGMIRGRQCAAGASTPLHRVRCRFGGGTALANLANRTRPSMSRANVPLLRGGVSSAWTEPEAASIDFWHKTGRPRSIPALAGKNAHGSSPRWFASCSPRFVLPVSPSMEIVSQKAAPRPVSFALSPAPKPSFLGPSSSVSSVSNPGATTPGGERKMRVTSPTGRRVRAQALANSPPARWPPSKR